MMCDQCKRRFTLPGKRWCRLCFLAAQNRVLEAQVLRLRADLYSLKAGQARVAAHPVSEIEVLDASIRRCRLCDDRYLPGAGHHCRRARKAVAS